MGARVMGPDLEDALSIWSYFPVLLNTLQPPPGGVAAVVARIGTTAQQIGNETVAYTCRK